MRPARGDDADTKSIERQSARLDMWRWASLPNGGPSPGFFAARVLFAVAEDDDDSVIDFDDVFSAVGRHGDGVIGVVTGSWAW